MTAIDPFESPKLLLARAKENAADFKARLEAFGKTNPWEIVSDPDLKTGEQIIKARLTNPLPANLRAVFSDAVNNLRHALDQAVNSAAIEIRGGQANCYFPFGRDAADFATIYASKRYKTVPVELRAFLDNLKPYSGGDELLCGLNRITGPNKHQAMLTIELSAPGFGMTGVFSGTGAFGGSFISKWDSAKNELSLARIGAGSQMKMNFQIGMNILLGGRNAMSGQPALGMLDALSSKAKGIVLGLEAEVRKVRSPPPS